MNKINDIQQEITDNFNLFDNWLDKYEFLIDLGKKLPDFDESHKLDKYLVKGCQSNVWLYHEVVDNKIHFYAASDSAIVSGLAYLLLTIYDNQSAEDIVNTKPEFIDKIGLNKHLSPTRKNGLYAMLTIIHTVANEALR